MKIKMFSKVLLLDGRIAYIVEMSQDKKVFLADIDLDDGEVSTEEIWDKDIKEVLDY